MNSLNENPPSQQRIDNPLFIMSSSNDQKNPSTNRVTASSSTSSDHGQAGKFQPTPPFPDSRETNSNNQDIAMGDVALNLKEQPRVDIHMEQAVAASTSSKVTAANYQMAPELESPNHADFGETLNHTRNNLQQISESTHKQGPRRSERISFRQAHKGPYTAKLRSNDNRTRKDAYTGGNLNLIGVDEAKETSSSGIIEGEFVTKGKSTTQYKPPSTSAGKTNADKYVPMNATATQLSLDPHLFHTLVKSAVVETSKELRDGLYQRPVRVIDLALRDDSLKIVLHIDIKSLDPSKGASSIREALIDCFPVTDSSYTGPDVVYLLVYCDWDVFCDSVPLRCGREKDVARLMLDDGDVLVWTSVSNSRKCIPTVLKLNCTDKARDLRGICQWLAADRYEPDFAENRQWTNIPYL